MKHSRRTAKVAEAIREVVATSILFGLRDPRVADVTILSVEAAGDLKTAKVFVSVMGDEKKQNLCMHGLTSSRGFLQRKIADQLDLRYTPVLTFVLDNGIKKSVEASRILREIAEAREAEELAQGQVIEENDDDSGDAPTNSAAELTANDESNEAAVDPDETITHTVDPSNHEST